MTILYLGDASPNSTANDRAQALRRCGHEVIQKDPMTCLRVRLASPLMGQLHYRTGFRFLVRQVQTWLEQTLLEMRCGIDLVWVNGGQYFSPKSVQLLKANGVPVVLYNNDDPTGGRDPGCWYQLLNALPSYDLCVSLRKSTTSEMRQRGAAGTLRVWMSYDEVKHLPLQPEEVDLSFQSSVAFIGTWMRHEGRHLFLKKLVQAGLNVRIWGDRWQKCGDSELIERCWVGKRASGRDYVQAVSGAKICLGLLSKGNRDLHTRRSAEIPFCGGLFCAERTEEHQAMYREGEEAIFWSSTEECIDQCNRLLADDRQREQIRLAGMKRVRELRLGNEDVCRQILERAFDTTAPRHSDILLPA